MTGTQTAASNTGVASGNTGVLANTGNVTGAGLNNWSGVGQFATNQALQNATSAVLNKALGQEGSLGDALTATLTNTFAAVGFNWVGDISQANQWQSGSLQKVGLHAIMGGLAAEAAGGDFKTGALVAGANEALIDSLAQQYSGMEPDQRIGLLTMNSQVLGVLVASMAGGDEQDMQIGASVAGNATKYNWDLHLPQGLMEYGESATSMADYLQQQGASPEEVNQALRAMARGEGFDGPQPAQEFMRAWAMAMLTGGGVVSHTAKGVTLVIGGAIGGGANITYQLSASDLEAINVTDASIATAVGALTQGRGLAGTVGVSMGGAYIGSEVKGAEPSGAVIAAGVGATAGAGLNKTVSSILPKNISARIKSVLGAILGGYVSEAASNYPEVRREGER